MIICQCTGLTKSALNCAIERARIERPGEVLTPAVILAAAGIKIDCAGCVPLLIQSMRLHPATSPFNTKVPYLGSWKKDKPSSADPGQTGDFVQSKNPAAMLRRAG